MPDAPDARSLSVFVLGASGSVGRLIVAEARTRGLSVTAQSRVSSRLAGLDAAGQIVALDPTDSAALAATLPGHDAVVFALGDRRRGTTLFSDATRALLPAMQIAGVRRLVAITGVGAGETRGHGGFLYDNLIFPLFTRSIYADKDRQEALIEASGLDWTIVRPAPFSENLAPGPLQVLTQIAPDTKLRRITRAEVAGFVLDQLASNAFLRRKPFIGHP
jgi:putative NADH-flavin reductase